MARIDIDARGSVIRVAASSESVESILEFVEAENSKRRLFQAFSYDSVIGVAHLKAAYVNTLLAFDDGSNIASRPHIEMLLFAAMTKQIGDAIRVSGIRSARRFVAFSDSQAAMRRFGMVARLTRFSATKEHSAEAARRLGFGGAVPGERGVLARMAESRLDL